MEEKDAVIVGARCAGSTLAIALAQRGWDVALVDRDTFPSDTTHMMFPNTLAHLERLGVLDTLRSHQLSPVAWRTVGLGHETSGNFTPIDGFDRGLFQHPGTAQGIGDAVAQGVYVADQLSGPDPSLDGYEAWHEERADGHYDWSFAWGRFPRPELSEKLFRGWASEPDAGQDMRDTLTRRVAPSVAMSEERLTRWFANAVPEHA